jgi:hypothetical protein
MAIQDELAFELDLEPQVLIPIDENWVLKLMQKGVLIQLHIGLTELTLRYDAISFFHLPYWKRFHCFLIFSCHV